LSEAEKVSYVAMKLTSQASRYWSALETLCELEEKTLLELGMTEGSSESKISLHPWNY